MLAKLTAALVAFGPIGILVLAFIDSTGIPVASGMDALVILVAAEAPYRAVLAASMAVLGSLIGNILLFWGARAGKRRFIKEAEPGNKRRFQEWFQRYGLLTVFIPCALPIPLPLKVFVISAAVCGTPWRRFIFVVVLGRAIRYGGEAYLGALLGKGSIPFLRSHTWHILIGAVVLFLALYAAVMILERRKLKATS